MEKWKYAALSVSALMVVGSLVTGFVVMNTDKQPTGKPVTVQQAGTVIVKTDIYGRPYRCWVTKDNAGSSTGSVYWTTPEGNEVILYNHSSAVRVSNGKWDSAFAEFGLTRQTCEAINRQVFDLHKGWVSPASGTVSGLDSTEDSALQN